MLLTNKRTASVSDTVVTLSSNGSDSSLSTFSKFYALQCPIGNVNFTIR